MTRKDYVRLIALLRYLKRWQKAHQAWLKWIDQEYRQRIARYKGFRRKAQCKLIEAADGLKFDKSGRVEISTAAGDRAKWAFRQACDQIFAATVLKGHELFQVTGKVDKAGLGSQRDIDRKFRAMAKKALRDAFKS